MRQQPASKARKLLGVLHAACFGYIWWQSDLQVPCLTLLQRCAPALASLQQAAGCLEISNDGWVLQRCHQSLIRRDLRAKAAEAAVTHPKGVEFKGACSACSVSTILLEISLS
jgi:hypothetical protein